VRTTFPLLTHDYEKTPVTLIKSSLSLNSLIAKFVGRIVYHLSASNWNVVFHRLRNKIHYLAGSIEDNPDVIDLTLINHSALDRSRLVQVLNGAFDLLYGFYHL
jgi:neurofibromin 1